jgi:reverse gyrase
VPKHLVIVESPAKARTIERYLGSDYRVLASYGHVRDLPENPGKGKLGVDVEHGFTPEYVVADDRRKQVADIEKAARSADTVYLATDLDREGEAIAWHVTEAAHVAKEKTRRVTFSEITESAIKHAFANPRAIDSNLVDAQQARRIVDRLRWLAQRAEAAVVLDLSEGDRRIGSPDLFAPEVDAVLAIDPERPAVHVHRADELVATYEPAIGLVGDMVAVS